MNKLYVEIFSDDKDIIYTSIESFLVLYMYNYLECPKDTTLIYIQRPWSTTEATKNHHIKLNTGLVSINEINLNETNAYGVNHLKLPVYSIGNTYISGLCAVCRELIKQTKKPCRKDLLGFKEGCLLSPSENSVWTKFCEIDIPFAVNHIFTFDFKSLSSNDHYKIPEAISRFEAHMNQPVRIHNLYKIIQDEARKTKHSLESKIENLKIVDKSDQMQLNDVVEKKKEPSFNSLNHRFAEGYFFTLADILLFPCFTMLFEIMPYRQKLEQQFPLTFKWLNEIPVHDIKLKKLLYELTTTLAEQQFVENFSYIAVECNKTSLYKSDPKRYKPKDRIFTKQENIEESLVKIASLHLNINSDDKYNSSDNHFDWSTVKDDAFPNFGDIPKTRLERKKQQLENLACAVISLATDNNVIVDFCSGSGHLGILLAIALPKCHIIFLENKARSLERAQQRVAQMNLKNCSFYQSNIDYFEGSFDIGASLHACGTATDIVLRHCIKKRAKFVCCPCCYGSITPMPHIIYPLSKRYQTILTEKDYLFIAHAADQFHNVENTPCNTEKCLQGEFCMDTIDTDRKLLAEEAGYTVVLSRLKPENCTTKNRLLIGKIM